mmetsp:Transcript_35221/g.111996  ORF Transcript_35221/g.111996 Transcript_35221/m.111996 type:complete len:250 (+) Transcript_35221:1518-2267(+)
MHRTRRARAQLALRGWGRRGTRRPPVHRSSPQWQSLERRQVAQDPRCRRWGVTALKRMRGRRSFREALMCIECIQQPIPQPVLGRGAHLHLCRFPAWSPAISTRAHALLSPPPLRWPALPWPWTWSASWHRAGPRPRLGVCGQPRRRRPRLGLPGPSQEPGWSGCCRRQQGCCWYTHKPAGVSARSACHEGQNLLIPALAALHWQRVVAPATPDSAAVAPQLVACTVQRRPRRRVLTTAIGAPRFCEAV